MASTNPERLASQRGVRSFLARLITSAFVLTLMVEGLAVAASRGRGVDVYLGASTTGLLDGLRRALDAAVSGAGRDDLRLRAAKPAHAEPSKLSGRLGRAEALLEEARRASLRMSRSESLGKCREALALLAAAGGRLRAPQLVARALAGRAIALLLRPPDVDGARQAFRAALDADPAYEPDPRRMSPSMVKLFSEAKALPSKLAPPPAPAFAAVARRTDATRIAWLGARAVDGGRVMLRAVVFDRKEGKLVQERRVSVQAAEIVARARRVLEQIARTDRPQQVAAAPPPQPARPPTVRRKPAVPLWRRWWFWGVIGGVVAAGAGLAIAISLTSPAEQSLAPGADIHVRFPP